MTKPPDLHALGLALPDYGGRELGAVLPAALDAAGGASAVVGRDAHADRQRLGIPRAAHVVVVLIDGLGHLNLEERRGHAPFLRAAEQGVITAGYPTTTASSLALFGTGQPSGRTGMTGYTALNPATGTLANLVSWEGAGEPAVWQPQPSLLARAEEAGMSVTSLGRRRFAGSGLTQAALRGGAFVGAESLEARVDAAVRAARTPGVTYCYWGELDAAGHKHGWQSHAWVAALESADQELRRLAASLPRDAVMVVTADHGMIDITGAPRWDAGVEPALAHGVRLTAGEPRALHVHTESGVAPADVADRWRGVLGDHAAVWTHDEAVGLGLFGEVTPAAAERIGDVVVAMAGHATVVDTRTQTEASLGLVGVHGSLTADELQVPLLIAGP